MRIILTTAILALISCTGMRPDPINSASLTNFQKDFLSKINSVRTAGCKCGKTNMPPVEPLSWNIYLARSAYDHANDMYKRRYFNHTSPTGKNIKIRIEEAGYVLTGSRVYAYGENIAADQRSIDQVMAGWLSSEGHCKNIMNKNFK